MTQNDTSGSQQPRSIVSRYVRGNLFFVVYAAVLVALMYALKQPKLSTAISAYILILVIAASLQIAWYWLWHVRDYKHDAEYARSEFEHWANKRSEDLNQWVQLNRTVLIIIGSALWSVAVMSITIASSIINRIGGVALGLAGAAVAFTIATILSVRRDNRIKASSTQVAAIADPTISDASLAPQETSPQNQDANADTVEIDSTLAAADTLKILAEVLAERDKQMQDTIEQLLIDREDKNRRRYDTSLAPKPQKVPGWIKEKIRPDEEIHGIIRKAWPDGILPILSLIMLAYLGFRLPSLSVTWQVLIILVIAWLIITAAVVIWLMKHIRYALVLTDKRFLRIKGVIQLRANGIDRPKITDFSTTRNLRGRICGYWSFKVETAGQTQAFDSEGLLAGRKKLCTYYEQHLGSER